MKQIKFLNFFLSVKWPVFEPVLFIVPCSFFRFSFRATLYFSLMNALVYVDIHIDQGIHKEKTKVARNEKRKKLRGFSYA